MEPASRAGADGSVPACWAPFSSMHLDPYGIVRACCQSTWQPLGDLRHQTLAEIWHGTEAHAMRARLSAGDLSMGCELCAAEIEIGAADAAYLHQFDHLPAEPDAGWPRQLELALSIACNLQCVMCNGELSSAIRTRREGRPALASPYDDRFFDQLDPFLQHVERITFLGGEPFLGSQPLRVMHRLIELGLAPTCHVVTNGTQWNDRIQAIVEALPMHLVVSIDGWRADTLEQIRVGVDRDQLVARIQEIRTACSRTGNTFALAFSLMLDNWRELADVLAEADRLDCDVFINTVTNPPRFSLHHCTTEQIEVVLREMEQIDADRGRSLERNRPVWEGAVAHVRSLAEARRADRGASPGETPDTVAAAAAHNHASPVTIVDVGDDLLIKNIGPNPADALGIDGRALVGQPSIRFMSTLGPTLGRLVRTDLRFVQEGVELRSFTYLDGHQSTEVVAAMARRSGGERWYISSKTLASDPGVPVAVPTPARR